MPAALASLDEYRVRAKFTSTNADEVTAAEEDLAACTRLLEHELGVAQGQLTFSTGTRVFDGSGHSVLYLRDRAGRAYFLQSIDADSLKIDDDLDGSFDDYTLDTDDNWVRGLPENAVADGAPFTAVELRPTTAATITAFPALPGCVEITGTWGLTSTLQQVAKAIVISMTRDLRDHFAAGSANQYQAIDETMPLTDQTWRLIRSMKQSISRKIPGIA